VLQCDKQAVEKMTEVDVATDLNTTFTVYLKKRNDKSRLLKKV
jgi:hypothetical protein